MNIAAAGWRMKAVHSRAWIGGHVENVNVMCWGRGYVALGGSIGRVGAEDVTRWEGEDDLLGQRM